MAHPSSNSDEMEAGGKQVGKRGEYGIRFTIPDKPPAEQLQMVKEMREVVLTFAKVAGEEDVTDLTPFDEAIAKLEADIADNATLSNLEGRDGDSK